MTSALIPVGILHALNADVQVIRGVKPVVEGQMAPLFGVAIRPHLMKPTTRHVQHLSSFQLALQASALCLDGGNKEVKVNTRCITKMHWCGSHAALYDTHQPRCEYATLMVRHNNLSCVS